MFFVFRNYLFNEIEHFDNFTERKLKKKTFVFEIAKDILSFIEQYNFEEYNTLIKEVFHFENSIFTLTGNHTLNEIEKEYEYNILEIRKNPQSLSKNKIDKIHIKFIKPNKQKIKIIKIKP